MVTGRLWKAIEAAGVITIILAVSAPLALAAEETEQGAEVEITMPAAIRTVGLALGAALAVGLAALATARVQAAVGSGGTGALVEKPDLFVPILVLIAIPETLVVFGFAIAILLWQLIG
ncbi:MAG TPA: F0F1 ATP synthase subunit C [Candidatus Hydrogenedentes bacterium]|nr:F0F1 ATP synthase subunit C [Candidatus Hydrogenedentota bacterium]HQE82898.1 F0F1 ATP synthase subunit C [Candidatus Hydrogenedentota bacterium]HQH52464.1 F0F1 ATP synthase subunit C [Candidatus Hydrogenedentota bacterium]HQM48003.1 F0F1 ATP synthase subunit C [Candidatus Hydrogenedentota bacterium]